ncbi:hypothetical protein [Pseudorhodoplanes sp.]|uniref:hypothetical protein n=1 Tax=Pseudorhodoplanes sp. TaxID=1934341 RepID=UPI00391966C2
MTSLQDRMLAASDEIDRDLVPANFHLARDAIRAGIAKAMATGAPDATLLAVLMAETLPRLVNAYGPGRAAIILARLGRDIGAGLAPNCRPQ